MNGKISYSLGRGTVKYWYMVEDGNWYRRTIHDVTVMPQAGMRLFGQSHDNDDGYFHQVEAYRYNWTPQGRQPVVRFHHSFKFAAIIAHPERDANVPGLAMEAWRARSVAHLQASDRIIAKRVGFLGHMPVVQGPPGEASPMDLSPDLHQFYEDSGCVNAVTSPNAQCVQSDGTAVAKADDVPAQALSKKEATALRKSAALVELRDKKIKSATYQEIHARLGFPSDKAMLKLGWSAPKNYLPDAMHAMQTRTKRTHINRDTSRAACKKPGERIYMDIAGPFPKALGSSHRYTIGFTDAMTGKSWAYSMGHKSEATQRLKQFVTELKHYNVSIDTLMTDNDSVFKAKDFTATCDDLYIRREYSAPECQWQNGVAEAFVQRCKFLGSAMLANADLTYELNGKYTVYAMLNAGHASNFIPSTRNREGHGSTPNHAWAVATGSRVASMHDLKVFGSKCHVYDSSHTGLAPRSLPGRILGCAAHTGTGSYDSDTYLVHMLDTGRTRYTRHLTLDEHVPGTSIDPDAARRAAAQLDAWNKEFQLDPTCFDAPVGEYALAESIAPLTRENVLNTEKTVTRYTGMLPAAAAESALSVDATLALGPNLMASIKGWILERCRRRTGVLASDALHTMFTDKHGNEVAYTISDLGNDLVNGYLDAVHVSEPGARHVPEPVQSPVSEPADNIVDPHTSPLVDVDLAVTAQSSVLIEYDSEWLAGHVERKVPTGVWVRFHADSSRTLIPLNEYERIRLLNQHPAHAEDPNGADDLVYPKAAAPVNLDTGQGLTPTLASAILETKAVKKAQAAARTAERKAAAEAACTAKAATDNLAYPMLGMYTAQHQITVKEVAKLFSVHPDAILAHATNYPNDDLRASTKFTRGADFRVPLTATVPAGIVLTQVPVVQPTPAPGAVPVVHRVAFPDDPVKVYKVSALRPESPAYEPPTDRLPAESWARDHIDPDHDTSSAWMISSEERIAVNAFQSAYAGEAHVMVELDGELYEFLHTDVVVNKVGRVATPDMPSVQSALAGDERDKWLEAIAKEYTSLDNNNTWTLVKRPRNHRALDVMLVLKRKRDRLGAIESYKARLVLRGDQCDSYDALTQLFAPVAMDSSFRMMCALAAEHDLEFCQLDFSTAFLNAKCDTEIYCKQGPGRDVRMDNDGYPMVYSMNKSCYGLPFAPKLWHDMLHGWLVNKQHARRSVNDPCVYRIGNLSVLIYVDDCAILYDRKHQAEYDSFLDNMRVDFKFTGGGEVGHFLGSGITRDRPNRTLYVDQYAFLDSLIADYDKFYADDDVHDPLRHAVTPQCSDIMLSKQYCPDTGDAGAAERKAMSKVPYAQLIGSLMWITRGTRLDCQYTVGMLARVTHNPGTVHWEAALKVLSYLKSTRDIRLTYNAHASSDRITASVDADFLPNYGDEFNNWKSTSGYHVYMGGAAVSWMSKRQDVIATSTAHAETLAAYDCTREILKLRGLKRDLGFPDHGPTVIQEDNQTVVRAVLNAGSSSAIKHWCSKIHWIRQCVDEKRVSFAWVKSADQMSDCATKPLPKPAFVEQRDHNLGISHKTFNIDVDIYRENAHKFPSDGLSLVHTTTETLAGPSSGMHTVAWWQHVRRTAV